MGKLNSTFIFSIAMLLCFHFSFAQDAINKLDKDGKRHGVWRKYYKNKRLRYQGKFNHGKEVGTFKYFSAASSDNPIVVKEFNANDGSSGVSFYTEEGFLLSKGKMNRKKRIGKWLFYHEDGKTTMSVENYTDGKLDGEYKTFYKTGKPTEIAYYRDGLLDSVYRKYSIKGYLYQHFSYKGGKLDGKAVYYNRKTGVLTTKGQFKDDVRVGTWENYIDGELVSIEQPNLKKERVKKQ